MRDLAKWLNPHSHYLWWLTPLVLLIGVVLFWVITRSGSRAFGEKVKDDLRRGEAAVHRVDVIDAIEVEELEDEGPSFFIKTTEGTILYFAGQYFYRYQKRKFPWKSFEIIEAPSSKVFFALKPLDSQFKPSYIRKPLSWEQAKRFGFQNYRTVDVDFNSLKEDGVASDSVRQ
jgi:hypothetical protein